MNGTLCHAGSRVCETTLPAKQSSFTNTLVYAVEKILLWRDRARSRHALLGLTDHMLQDIGVDRATAQVEGSRPFWKD